MPEKQSTFFILNYTQSNIGMMKRELDVFKGNIERVAKPLWDYSKPPLTSIDEVPFENPEDEYGILYYLEGANTLMFSIDSELIVLDHSFNIGQINFSIDLTNVLRKVFQESLFVVTGFEIEIDMANSFFISVLISDKLLPLISVPIKYLMITSSSSCNMKGTSISS